MRGLPGRGARVISLVALAFVNALAVGDPAGAAQDGLSGAAGTAVGTVAAPAPSAHEVRELLQRVLATRVNPVEHRELLERLPRDCTGCFEPVLEIFEGGFHDLADAAAETLGALGDRRAVDPLAQEVLEGRPPERRLIAESPRIEGYFAQDLARIYALRVTAASALGRIGSSRAIEALADSFNKGDYLYERMLVRERIFDAATGHDVTASSLPAFPKNLLSHAARVLAAVDPVEAVGTLSRALSHREEWVSLAAMAGLVRCASHPEARDVLLPLLSNADTPQLAAELTEVVGREFSDAEVTEAAMAFIDDEECNTRALGLSILMARTDPEGGRPSYPVDDTLRHRLDESLAMPCFNVAALAATILHRTHLTETLQRALRDGDTRFVAENFVYYVMAGGEESERALVRALDAYGNAAMHDIFAICGNAVLLEAANEWISSSRNARKEDRFTLSLGLPISWGVLSESGDP